MVGPPRGGDVVAAIACSSQWGHAGSHDGDMSHCRREFELTQRVILLEVIGGDKALCDVVWKVNTPQEQTLICGP